MTAHRPPRLRLAATMALAVTVLASIVVGAAPAHAAGTLDPRAGSALDWLAGELDAHDGLLQFDGGTFKDYGLTIDAVLALAAGGRGHVSAADATMTALEAHVASYVTDADFGAGTDRYAGAFAKTLLAAEVEGVDATAFGPFNLETELRARMQDAAGATPGRFSDLVHDTTYGSDFSNGLTQALAVLALSRTDAGIPPAAVAFLLAQQCPAGGFRLFYDVGTTCTTDDDIDLDATTFALEALSVAGSSTGVSTALASATSWLVGQQDATGAFAGTGPTATINANSTGIAAQALRQRGKTVEANKAAAWIATLQLTTGDDAGALSYDPADRDDATANGITTNLAKFERATAQGVLALGLPALGQIGTVTPVLPVDPAPTPTAPAPTASLSTSAASPGDTITVTGTGFTPGESVNGTMHSITVALGAATADAAGVAVLTFVVPAVELGPHAITLVGQQSGVTATTTVTVVDATAQGVSTTGTAVSGPELARSGQATTDEAMVALKLLVAGGLLLIVAARRRRRFSTS